MVKNTISGAKLESDIIGLTSGLEIQVRECASTGSNRYMAWLSGHHHSFAVGRSPLEAIGALVSENKDLFDVEKINFR